MFNLAHIYFYQDEKRTSNIDKIIQLLVKSLTLNVPYFYALLCLAMIKKHESLTFDKIREDIDQIDKKSSHSLSKKIYSFIQESKLVQPVFYNQLYNELKDINLVYYGNKIENQTQKKKIEYINNSTLINEKFYEGLGNIL